MFQEYDEILCVQVCEHVCRHMRACAGVRAHVWAYFGNWVNPPPQLSHFIDHMKVCFHVVKNSAVDLQWNFKNPFIAAIPLSNKLANVNLKCSTN